MDVGILIMGVIFIIMAKVVMDITRKNMKKEKKVNIKSNIFNKYPKISDPNYFFLFFDD